jgi:RNA polymerase sigma factor (sigma-70 family)
VRETVDVNGQLLARAQTGDGDAFAELTEPFRRELQAHCYRILGSAADAEDMLQETMMAAWRGLDRFEERASVRTWLHAIATNKCLNQLRASRSQAPHAPEIPMTSPTSLGEYHLYHASRAELLRELGHLDQAHAADRRALELTTNPAKQAVLQQRLAWV